MAVNGVALACVGAGSVFLYAGVTGKDIPSALQAIISGKAPSTAAKKYPIIDQPDNTANPDPGNSYDTPGGGTPTENKVLAKFMAAGYGWGTGAQWTALNNVIMRESGYNNKIYNGGTVGGAYQTNKAYGIAQALGHGPGGAPYPAGDAGNPPGAGGTSSATAQIAWMLAYIKNTYGNPEGAWNSEETVGSY